MKRNHFMLRSCALSVCALLLPASAMALSVDASDTIVDVVGAKKVFISETDSVLRIRISGSAQDSAYQFCYSKKMGAGEEQLVEEKSSIWKFGLASDDKKNTEACCGQKKRKPQWNIVGVGGFTYGFMHTLDAPADWSFRMGRSGDFSAHFVDVEFLSANRRHSLRLGVGLGSRFFTLDSRSRMFATANGGLQLVDFPEHEDCERSRLVNAYFTFPLRYKWTYHKDWWVAAEAALNWNIGAHATNRYENLDHKYREEIENIHQTKAAASFRVATGWDELGVFFQYVPTSFFKEGHGPQFHHYAVGITFFY
ncbi:MAG: hypothetical protein ACI353_01650 [Alloprevotella sp.]